MKLPAIQFYPGDWHKDPGVQALDLRERGAWFEILLMMFESDQRGVLLLNGKPMPVEVLARHLGLVIHEVNQILTTLVNYGVATLRKEDGALICRRMVRDEEIRKMRQNAGKLGGNPLLLKGEVKQKRTTQLKQKSTPSSSSSSSSSSSVSSSVSSSDTIAPVARARNPLIDALASVDGSKPEQVTAGSWAGIGKALAEIKAVTPDVTPEEINRRASNYATHFRDAHRSAHALAKHWSTCNTARPAANGAVSWQRPTGDIKPGDTF